MLKYAFLASAMMIAVPALAQDNPSASQATPLSQAEPDQSVPNTAPMATDPADPGKSDAAPADDTGGMTAATDPAKPADQVAAEAQPVTGADQIAAVVNAEFPAYDKDANGSLSETEFAAWMVALKTKSDPATDPNGAATKTWVDQAFATADTDKNRALSKDEVTGFLSQGA